MRSNGNLFIILVNRVLMDIDSLGHPFVVFRNKDGAVWVSARWMSITDQSLSEAV